MVDALMRLAFSGSDRSAGVATIVTALNRVAESRGTESRRGALVVSWARAALSATSNEIIVLASDARTDKEPKNTGPPNGPRAGIRDAARSVVSGGRLGRHSSAGAETRTQPRRIRDSTSSHIRCCELHRAGRTVRERLGVCPADPCYGEFSVMLLQRTDDCAEGKGDGSCDNGLRCAAAALIHARVVERCAIGAGSRDLRRLAGPASVTECS